MGYLFGTDGIRGVANQEPVTAEIALRLGKAVAQVFSETGRRRVLVGRDTRLSCDMLESAVVAGLTSGGMDVTLLGVVPTPAVALLTKNFGAAAGIMISASHNSFEDNGLKVFQSDGYKCSPEIEAHLENLILQKGMDTTSPIGFGIGRVSYFENAAGFYKLKAQDSFSFTERLHGIKIVVDCANGAATETTPSVLRELGAEVITIHAQPDGCNINHHCGSTHPEALLQAMKEHQAQIGIAHDGDADRVLLCDENHELLDGDEILAIIALDFLKQKRLQHATVVATHMSNLGLDEALSQAGGKVVRVPIGDKHVIEEMLRGDYNLGGEQSGHIIVRDYATTGDGLVTALQILRIMKVSHQPLSQLRKCINKYPQAQFNVNVREKPPLESIPEITQALREAEKALGNQGRVLLRYSGTEPKIRLLVEAKNADQVSYISNHILQPIKSVLGT
ncbi:MAG: phosphoglucosamine mutase [Methylacidiphilales bacterium]|nr:phosphoglucosamine mutase [Candidatus Methylacidiphilales bacterium]MDW8349300.1 phosphoglucosamine mutase [Verrucomicrobiae bacterium]